MAREVDADLLLDRVQEISPIIRELAGDAERNRQLSGSAVRIMQKNELYNMSRPKEYGGLELDPITVFRVVEEVARHDSAAGWNLQLSVAASCFLAWLPDEGAASILSDDPNTIIAASFTPGREARAVDGGYRVSGQWPFVSGSHDCDWVLLLPELLIGGQIGRSQRLVFVPAQEIKVLDTWYALGMRGTGSHDILLEDVFIPDHHTAPFAPLDEPGRAYRGPLYRLTIWFPIGLLATPALGIARAAIDDFTGLARTKTPSFTDPPLSRRQVVQRQLAQAEATLVAGRAYLHQVFADCWGSALQGQLPSLEQKLKMQLATTHAVDCAAKAVDLVHAAAGASSIREEHHYQRYFRDVHTITQHAFCSSSRYESVGAGILGAESDWGFFSL